MPPSSSPSSLGPSRTPPLPNALSLAPPYPTNNRNFNTLAKHFHTSVSPVPLQRLCVAIFVANVNALAWTGSIPIEMVHRAGFGFNPPSVAETGNTFRVNIGIVPTAYADLVARALVETLRLLILITTNILDAGSIWSRLGNQIAERNSVPVKSEHTLLYELMRRCWRVDVLIDQLWKQQAMNEHAVLVNIPMLEAALQLMEEKLIVSTDGSLSGSKIKQLVINEKQQWPEKTFDLLEDLDWYVMMNRLLRSLGSSKQLEGIRGAYMGLTCRTIHDVVHHFIDPSIILQQRIRHKEHNVEEVEAAKKRKDDDARKRKAESQAIQSTNHQLTTLASPEQAPFVVESNSQKQSSIEVRMSHAGTLDTECLVIR